MIGFVDGAKELSRRLWHRPGRVAVFPPGRRDGERDLSCHGREVLLRWTNLLKRIRIDILFLLIFCVFVRMASEKGIRITAKWQKIFTFVPLDFSGRMLGW